MGTKLISLRDIKPTETLPPGSIVYPDLVTTLKHDQTKYLRPVMNEKEEIVQNAIFLEAAREAGLTHIVVDGPWESNDYHPNKVHPDEILRNYVFFDSLDSSTKKLWQVFSFYQEQCEKALEHPTLTLGNVNEVKHLISGNEILEYALFGKLTSPENKDKLIEPTRELYSKLEEVMGNIRSVNGIKKGAIEVLNY